MFCFPHPTEDWTGLLTIGLLRLTCGCLGWRHGELSWERLQLAAGWPTSTALQGKTIVFVDIFYARLPELMSNCRSTASEFKQYRLIF